MEVEAYRKVDPLCIRDFRARFQNSGIVLSPSHTSLFYSELAMHKALFFDMLLYTLIFDKKRNLRLRESKTLQLE
jgi:hypothetical protein